MHIRGMGKVFVGLLLLSLVVILPQSVRAEVTFGEVVTQANKITLGAEIRSRYENRDNDDFNDATNNSVDYTFLRTRLNVGIEATDDVNAFIQIQDSRIYGDEFSEAADTQNVDLHLGYVDLLKFAGQPVTLRVGRQKLSYGDQRLIGGFEWNNVGRAHDGIKAMIKPADNFQIDLFATKVQEFDNIIAGDRDQNFYGAYAMLKPGKQTVDGYLLYLEANDPSLLNPRGTSFTSTDDDDLHIWTVGTRMKGPIAGENDLDYGFEGAYQFGESAGLDIKAFALHAEAGVALPLFQKSRLSIEGNYATGDDNSSDKDFETFSNLFHTNHMHYGYMDRVAWMNAKNFAIKLDSKITEKLSTKLHFWDFRLAEEQDALYNAGGGTIISASAANKKDEVGNEVDLIVNYKYNKVIGFQFGYSHFFIGDAVEEANKPTDEDADFAYLQMSMKF
jgi:hypothetical protein